MLKVDPDSNPLHFLKLTASLHLQMGPNCPKRKFIFQPLISMGEVMLVSWRVKHTQATNRDLPTWYICQLVESLHVWINSTRWCHSPLLTHTRMCQELGKWVITYTFKWGIYNPLTNLLLTSWDIQVCILFKIRIVCQLLGRHLFVKLQNLKWKKTLCWCWVC